MSFRLTPLPYDQHALEPYFSSETLAYHHGKHHQAYVNQLNNLIQGTQWETASLEEIIASSNGAIYSNAAQIWNHEFYWACLSGQKQTIPPGLSILLEENFGGSIESFKQALFKNALQVFGSGWTWLVQKDDLTLSIQNYPNGDAPLNQTQKPLLAIDVWEHAYYIDFRNQRAVYLEALWQCLNWEFIYARLQRPIYQSMALNEMHLETHH